MEEIWKDVPGYEGYYQVSNLGQVKAIERIYKQRNGLTGRDNYRTYPEQTIFVETDRDGYLKVRFSKGGKQKKFFVHRLVALTFIPNPENKPEVNHKSGIKVDNCASNLEWVTTSENQQHAHDNKLYDCQRGERNGHAKLSELDVREIHALSIKGFTQESLAAKFGVKSTTISRILAGKRWRHVYLELYG